MKKILFATALTLVLAFFGSTFAHAQEESEPVNWAPTLHLVVAATVEASPELSTAEEQIYAELMSIQVLNDPATEAQASVLTATLGALAQESSYTLFTFNVHNVSAFVDYLGSVGIGIESRPSTCNCRGDDDCAGSYSCETRVGCIASGGSLAIGVCRDG